MIPNWRFCDNHPNTKAGPPRSSRGRRMILRSRGRRRVLGWLLSLVVCLTSMTILRRPTLQARPLACNAGEKVGPITSI